MRFVARAKEDGYIKVDRVECSPVTAKPRRVWDWVDDLIVCVMDDEHLNVFVTLSLRQLLPEVRIYAIFRLDPYHRKTGELPEPPK